MNFPNIVIWPLKKYLSWLLHCLGTWNGHCCQPAWVLQSLNSSKYGIILWKPAINLSFLSIHSGLSDLLPPDAVGPLITSFLPFPSLSFQTPVMFLCINILAGSLLFLLLISHYPWFPLELHSPFKNNGNNLTCTCKLKVNKPKQWDPVVNDVLMLVNMRAEISSAMHTMAEKCRLG